MDINTIIINELQKKKNTQKQLAEYIKVSTSTVNNWLKLGRSVPAEYIIPISEFLKINPYYLLTGEEKETDLPNNEKELLESFRLLQLREKYKVIGRIETYLEEYNYSSEADPEETDESFIINEEPDNNITYLDKYRESKYETELWGEVSAGSGIDAIPNRETIKVPFKCDFALRVRGNSMEPLYHDQQIIYLKQQSDVEQGQIAVVQIDDYIPISYLKKVYKENSHIRLVSINPLYEDKIYPASQVKILGTIINNDLFF